MEIAKSYLMPRCVTQKSEQTERVITTPFYFFGSRQGVAPNYEVDFLVWCTMKSEVNSQKEIESTVF